MSRSTFSRARKERLVLFAGAIAGAVVIAVLMVASVTVQNGLPGNKGAQLDLQFRSVGNVNRYDDVRVAGRRVGGVASISYQHGHANVRVRLSEGLDGLRDSTKARIRLAGLIGAQYVELVPGTTGRPLHSGATIPLSRTSTSPDVFAALTAFDKPRVRDLRAMFRALGAGFAGQGAGANRALRTTPPLLDDAGKLLDSLDQDPAALRRLLPAAASFVGALVPAREDIAKGFAAGERAMRPLAEHPRETEALMRESAGIVREAPIEMRRAEPLMHETERLSVAVTRLTEHAPGGLRRATLALQESPRPLRVTTPVMRRVRTTVPPVLQLIARVSPLVSPFGRSLDSALPPIREAAKRTCDYDETIPWMRSVVAYSQGDYNLIRALSGGDGFTGESVGPDFEAFKTNKHDEDPPPCKAAGQVTGG
jgi:virulence factor Mce-like protein